MVILAAGGSTRLGQPKQLLPYRGITLVEHAARTALDSGANEVVVVTGCEARQVADKLKELALIVAFNLDWAEGMGSSIRCGVSALGADIACVVISLCDQPRTTQDLLRDLAQRHFKTGAPIVASSYEGVMGAPSRAFGAELFPKLMSLTGDSGARELIRTSSTLDRSGRV